MYLMFVVLCIMAVHTDLRAATCHAWPCVKHMQTRIRVPCVDAAKPRMLVLSQFGCYIYRLSFTQAARVGGRVGQRTSYAEDPAETWLTFHDGKVFTPEQQMTNIALRVLEC